MGTQQLQNLIELAKEPSGERRRELLREVTDLFMVHSEHLNPSETEHFNDIMGKVAFELEMKVRKELAERLSETDAAPHELITKLANDEIEVARPVLMKSNVLKNSDLIDIVRSQGQDHLLAVTGRDVIDEEVSDHLVEHGDDQVLESLVKNEGAKISRQSMETVVIRAEDNEKLHAPLVTRKDIPPDLMNEMFFFVSNTLREQIMKANEGIDENLLDEVIKDTKLTLEEETKGLSGDWSQPERFIRRKQRFNELNQSLLVQLLRQGQMPEFVVGFARLADIDIRTAQRIIFDSGCEALAVGCKAIKFDRSTFSNLMLLTDSGKVRKPEEVAEVIEMYDHISVESAQRALRFWRTRMNTQSKAALEKASASMERG
ncbi:MAG: DUF2336 domain-containing protein [Rhodospirillales bacterium]|nr:DUF2336 domain-containing protein [Rhodospirillales bacterium]